MMNSDFKSILCVHYVLEVGALYWQFTIKHHVKKYGCDGGLTDIIVVQFVLDLELQF